VHLLCQSVLNYKGERGETDLCTDVSIDAAARCEALAQ